MSRQRCKVCKGKGKLLQKNRDTGLLYEKECLECEGSGVPLRTITEEEFKDGAELMNLNMFSDDDRYLDVEEEDYEI